MQDQTPKRPHFSSFWFNFTPYRPIFAPYWDAKAPPGPFLRCAYTFIDEATQVSFDFSLEKFQLECNNFRQLIIDYLINVNFDFGLNQKSESS